MHDIEPSCEGFRLVRDDHFFGEFAHIRAANDGGERWLSSMSDEERNDIANIIVLCPNHHTIIDKKDNGFTAEQLLEIKARHEGQDTPLMPEVSEIVLEEALVIANIGIFNINANNDSGTQHVTSMANATSQASYAVRDVTMRDVYVINGVPSPSLSVIPAVVEQLTAGFHSTDQVLTLVAEITSLEMRPGLETLEAASDSIYLSLAIGEKRFIIRNQELVTHTAGVAIDGAGKYAMDVSVVSSILENAHLFASGMVDGHSLADEIRLLSRENSLSLIIETGDPAIRKIPFEKVDAASAQCANPVKLILRGKQ